MLKFQGLVSPNISECFSSKQNNEIKTVEEQSKLSIKNIGK